MGIGGGEVFLIDRYIYLIHASGNSTICFSKRELYFHQSIQQSLPCVRTACIVPKTLYLLHDIHRFGSQV